MREIELLQLAIAPEGVGMSLADGGVPVEGLSQGYPEADCDKELGDMFLESWGVLQKLLKMPHYWPKAASIQTVFISTRNGGYQGIAVQKQQLHHSKFVLYYLYAYYYA